MNEDPEFVDFVGKMRWLSIWLFVSCIVWFVVGWTVTWAVAELFF